MSTSCMLCSSLRHQSEKMVLSDMETICINPTSRVDKKDGIISRSVRDLAPADYLFKVESYSVLVYTDLEKYETDHTFQSGGYNWRLILYPSGNQNSNGRDYVSLYLAIADTDDFTDGWEVNVNFKLFVFDSKNNNYLTIQDGAVRKFDALKTEWGFDQLIALEVLLDSSNGYAVEDNCVFGAEVFVVPQYSNRWESLSFVKDPPRGSFTWKLDNFSKLNEGSYLSESFTVSERDWKLMVYPNGEAEANGKALSFYLALTDCEKFPPNRRVYAKYKLELLDQLHGKNHAYITHHWYTLSNQEAWGYRKFVTLSDVYEAEKGYIKDDAIIVKVEILTTSIVKISS